jgi:predicted NBD/HSP70 family sugar kinase
MRQTIGVVTAERVAVGVVEDSHLVGPIRVFPEHGSAAEALHGLPAEAVTQRIFEQIEAAIEGREIAAVGLGFPGIIRCGVVEDSPNLHQVKGLNLQQAIASALREKNMDVPVAVFNDADAMAAGIAATRGHLDRMIRVWTLGNGIGYGRYPYADGVWEGGHTVVSLDPKERYCGCGGVGHLEGIMGHRAMRLRFLDMEPDEIFSGAKAGDTRCVDFVRLWHRALAAATASSIHMAGPGKFYITGANARFVDIDHLNQYLQEMVKMSPLQGYVFEIVPGGDEIAIIGAAVNAERAAFGT